MSALLAASGCSKPAPEVLPELAPVSGVVKLDGKPLSGASVQFTAQGKTSAGLTDGTGKYVLKYRDKLEGGPVGTNTVRIVKFEAVKDAEGKEIVGPSVIPSRYNDTTMLSAPVKPNSPNEHNFDLKSR